jgi:hypothetical protein
VIVYRFPDVGSGRISLNGVEMKFSTCQVEKIVLAVDELQRQIRSAVIRDLRKHVRRNHQNIPIRVERPDYFDH